ncbi:hypothetical protein ARMGADRAFT_11084 [Armillaria gallica]|uniref:Uncharacterized protein n=1 Tax=Armillaria gallica TaxID=47427 RepID=A0A2H3E787_ARMGA|nr:hypothetical protein ARMGADRAFT_11084 [Armillaria gallica]
MRPPNEQCIPAHWHYERAIISRYRRNPSSHTVRVTEKPMHMRAWTSLRDMNMAASCMASATVTAPPSPQNRTRMVRPHHASSRYRGRPTSLRRSERRVLEEYPVLRTGFDISS